jgi:N-acetyl-anhydromuramyl-L-alanine amidase AmpD
MRTIGRVSLLLLAVLTLLALPLAAQSAGRSSLSTGAQQLDRWFDEAGAEFDVPSALLRSIAFVETRWTHIATPHAARTLRHLDGTIEPSDREAADNDLPPVYGIMGLRDDDHFGHSLVDAAAFIGRTPEEVAADPRLNIRAAAALLHVLGGGKTAATPLEQWEAAAAKFSGIPQESIARVYTYDVFHGIAEGRASDAYRVGPARVDLEKIYGTQLLGVLAAPRLTVDVKQRGNDGLTSLSADYAPALWNAAASCDYTVGRTVAITNITIHTTQGSYASTISWFQNCSSQVSAHYVVRSSDGQITQMVLEKDKAWHVGSENGYTIGIEHEGFIDNPTAWYTDAMYNASALLTRDICASYGFDKTRVYDGSLGWNAVISDRAAVVAKGHVNFPNQTHTDPGSGWNWAKYKSLVVGSTGGTTTQLFANAGFESGNVSWVAAASSDITTSTSYAPRTGSWYAWLGGWATAHTDYLYQTVTIPSTATSATLSFYLRVATAETTTTTAYDTLKVQLRDTANNVLTQLVSLSNLSASCCYAQKSFDVSAYKGRTLRVYFQADNDNGNQTSFLVDDAALTVQQ